MRVAGCQRPDSESDAVVVRVQEELPLRSNNEKLPSAIDYSGQLLSVRDQGSSDMCVAFAAATMKEYQDMPGVHLDPASVYNRRANATKPGMLLSDAMRILKEYGIDPNPQNHRIKQYWHMGPRDVDTIKRAMFRYGVVVASFPFNENAKDYKFWIGASANSSYGHCVALVGYDDSKQSFRLRNSWGTDYAEMGYAWINYDEFVKHCWQVYCAEDSDAQSNPEQQQKTSCCSGCVIS